MQIAQLIRNAKLSVRNAIYYRRQKAVADKWSEQLRTARTIDDARRILTGMMLESVGLTVGGGVPAAGIYLTPAQRSWKSLAEKYGYSVRIKA